MKLLLIDTCGASGSVALAEAEASPAILASETLPGRTASERLVPAIKSLIEGCGTSLQSLSAIAVVHGPGSFTGVRVGLSAAKGLCQALNIPIIAISRLAVLAGMAQSDPDSPNPNALTHSRIHALLDAGRDEFYFGDYSGGICLREALLTRDQVFSTVHASGEERAAVVVACEPAVVASLAELAPQLVPEPTAAAALRLALQRIQAKRFDDIAEFDANYVRRTDSEIFAKPSAKATPTPTPWTPAR
jgi:tRNA threonylcarbamoyladenosine biosynthesis protein TsaB